MVDGDYYVVKFSDGTYFAPFISEHNVSTKLKEANLYVFDWQVAKDLHLRHFIKQHKLSYEVFKVKTTTMFELINN